MKESEFEFNTQEGKKRSDAIFNLVEVLLKQDKTFMDGILVHNDSNTRWEYSIKKQILPTGQSE